MTRILKTASLLVTILICTVRLCADTLGYKVLFLPPTAQNADDLNVVPNVDYYSILISSVFLNRNETFFTKNNVAVVVTLTVDGKELTVPVYAKRDPGVAGLLGIHNYALLTSIPASGTVTQIGIDIRRRNPDDPVKKVLDFATSRDNDALLKTYAASSLPYLSLFGGLAKSLYTTFGTPADGEILFSSEKITLTQTPAGGTDAFRLRESTFLIYRSDTTLVDSKLHLDNAGNVIFSGPEGDQALQGFPWVAIRVQRFPKRLDYSGRDWYDRFQLAYQQILNADNAEADKTAAEARVLLFTDKDFTLAQKQQEATTWKATLESAKTTASNGHTSALVRAFESARIPLAGLKLGETPVTAKKIVAAPGVLVRAGAMTIDIDKLKVAVQDIQQ